MFFMAYTPLYSDVNRVNPRTNSRVFDFTSVQHSLDNILRTPKRQRLFYPWGTTLDPLLFSLDIATLYRVQNVVFEALTQDPRVVLLYNQIQVFDDPTNNTVTVIASFGIQGLAGQTFTKTWTVGGYNYGGAQGG